MDFTHPDVPIDGKFTRVLFVRDVASGCTLLAKPCMSESSEDTVNALTGLFAVFGPPLVLKSDNGSAFASEEVQLLLEQNSVIPLFSPPHWPRYNGGVWLRKGVWLREVAVPDPFTGGGWRWAEQQGVRRLLRPARESH